MYLFLSQKRAVRNPIWSRDWRRMPASPHAGMQLEFVCTLPALYGLRYGRNWRRTGGISRSVPLLSGRGSNGWRRSLARIDGDPQAAAYE